VYIAADKGWQLSRCIAESAPSEEIAVAGWLAVETI